MTRHDRHPLEDLPGDLMIWVLILSELLVFGAGLAAFLAVRMRDPAGFAAAEALLHRSGAALGTLALVTSGWLAALATAATAAGGLRRARWQLLAAAALGLVFLGVKASEYSALAGMGIGTDTSAFFTFFYLLTGFHAAHVVAGVGLLLAAAIRPAPRPVEAIAAFWHMVDLVWVLILPVVFLL